MSGRHDELRKINPVPDVAPIRPAAEDILRDRAAGTSPEQALRGWTG